MHGAGRKCRVGCQPGQPALHLSRQTDRPWEEGREMIAGLGVGWCGVPVHVVTTAGIRHQRLEGGRQWALGTEHRYTKCARMGFSEGSAHQRLNHFAFAELGWWLLGTPVPDRDDFYAHPQRGHFLLLLRAQQSTLTNLLIVSQRLQDSKLSQCPSLLPDGNAIFLAEHRAPHSVGDPGGLLSLIVQWAGSRWPIRLSLRLCRNYPVRCEEWQWWGCSAEC